MSKFAAMLLAVAVATGCSALAAQRDAEGGPDTSYDQVERNRGDGIESRPADHSYDAVERNRGDGIESRPADHSYDAVEKNRGDGLE